MFTRQDFKAIDKAYFFVQAKLAYHIILKSNNTGHTWDITCQDNPRGRSLIINHKHNETDPYHVQPQMHPQTVTEAQEMIKKHDAWQMDGRKG